MPYRSQDSLLVLASSHNIACFRVASLMLQNAIRIEIKGPSDPFVTSHEEAKSSVGQVLTSAIGDEAAGMVNQSFPIILGNNKIQTNISGARKINVGFKLSLASFTCICFICGSFFFNFASLTLSLPIIADLSSLLYDDTSFDIRFVPSTSENLFRE